MSNISRRVFVGSTGVGLAMAITFGRSAMAKEPSKNAVTPRFAYVGSRTTKERKARGRGIEVYRVINNDEAWEHIQLVDVLTNPSFLITDPEARFVFTVHGDQSEVSSFHVDEKSGKLTKIASADTRGKNPVHLAPHVRSKSLLIANYATGSIVRVPVDKDGKLGDTSEPLLLPGQPGPHKTEQTSSHPHQIVADPSGQFFIVPDKGLDQIFTLQADDAGNIRIASSTRTRQGAGPRHMVFGHTGAFAYVINELDSTITVYRYFGETGKLEPVGIVSCIPPEFVGDNRSAALVLSHDGSSIYATNRGHNSVVHFKIIPDTGLLGSPRWHETKGAGPRFASLSPSGETLFVANELTDTIVSFSIGKEGSLTPNEEIVNTGSPVSILML